MPPKAWLLLEHISLIGEVRIFGMARVSRDLAPTLIPWLAPAIHSRPHIRQESDTATVALRIGCKFLKKLALPRGNDVQT
jgi:hypothetical protein